MPLFLGAAPARCDTIESVAVDRPFFNPSLGQSIGIRFELACSGDLTVLVLDRDGYLLRRLVSSMPVLGGQQRVEWDGLNDTGAVVPDEAYSLKIDLAG